MRISLSSSSFGMLSAAILATPLLAAEPQTRADGRPKWDMDYGPFLNLTVQMPGEAAGSTPKGIVIRVGAEKEGTIAFDTDLLRCTGGWTGGFVDFKGVAFSGSHGGNPGPVGNVAFRTSAVPGWSKAGSFADPRPLPKGFGASTIPFGPLPSDWAKYKGLYRHGEQVVLSYTVGNAAILESPSLEGNGEMAVLVRSFNVSSAGAASTVFVAEVPENAVLDEKSGCVVLSDDSSKSDSRLVLKAVGAPAGAKWKWIAPGQVGLELPEFKGGERFKIAHWRGNVGQVDAMVTALRAMNSAGDLTELTKPGRLLWPEIVTTQGSVGTEDGAFQVDKVEIPVKNPWRSWLRIGGMDFFKDGRIAFSTLAGDVWVGSGIDDSLQNIKWKRFAAGLHQPLGLKIVDDVIHVTCRDGIVRLVDENGDGEADFYQAFNNDVHVTPNFHEFMFELQTDSEGNFYFVKGGPVKGGGRGWDPIGEHNGTMMKVSKDGSKFEVFATGFRAPNGIGMGPGDVITTGDNEGTWVPMCYLHIVKKGSFLSVPDLSHKDPLPTKFDPHVCFFPKSVDNSSGGQVWVTSDKWGPLKGRLFHLSYGTASLYEVMMEDVGGVVQGGVSKVPLKFDTGLMRARFSPVDGQMYLAGQKGWQTTGAEDGAIHRVRYTGKAHYAPSGLKVTDRGIHITFDEPLDPETAGNPDNYSIEQYNYRWTSNYGSKDYRPSNPEELGHDTVDITGVALSADRKTVFLEAAGLGPVMQSEITMRVKAASGVAMPEKIWHTINAVGHETGPVLTVNKGPNTAPAPKTAGSGVALVLKAGGKTDVRKDRLVALHVPEGTNASPFLPKGPFTAEWESVLAVSLRKQVTLLAEGTGQVKVSVNDTPVFEGALAEAGKRLEGKLELRKGGNRLKVEYTSPQKGDSTFRLLWASSEFGVEPVQPTSLYLPAESADSVAKMNQVREGRSLFAQSNCVACHDGAGVLSPKGQAAAAMPELSRGAPMLTDIGARFDQGWVAKWLQNPHQFRENSRMPAVLHGAASAQQAADIAAFLGSQGTPAADPVLDGATAGGALFANLGCVACHSTPTSKVGNNFNRVSLNHVSAKWKAAALNDYLQDPQKYHPGAAMPKTPMSDKEALQLTAFLMSFPKAEASAMPTGDIARGAQLLTSVGCLQCHAGVPGTALSLEKVISKDLTSGCLGATAEKRGAAPDFAFGAEKRDALLAFLKAGKEAVATVEKDSAADFAKRAVNDLRCVACHQMDARQSVWSSVTEEGNMLGGLKAPKRDPKKPEQAHAPIPTTSIPRLTWLGEKLQPTWSAKMIAGQMTEKPRHYILGRMPGFPAYAEQIAKGLSHWHGYSDKPTTLGAAPADLVATGEKLLGDQGGFACTVCHDLGKKPATAPFEAPALNLAWAGNRLRLSYFERWLQNPQRVDPETKMPRYVDGQMKTQLKQILDGDGAKQFDAIRQYLLSVQE
ncbi:MAG: DUF6797 domain-containing protein [Verrucomicrobiota bacterium]